MMTCMVRVRAAGFLSLLCLVGGSAAQDRNELVRELDEARPPGSVPEAQSHEINGFRISSARTEQLGADLEPTSEQVRSLRVTAGVPFGMAVQSGGSSGASGIAVFHEESGQPMLSASDENGDGHFDVLTYSTLNEDREVVLTVTDYEWDGQPDLRVDHVGGFGEIWYSDGWRRVLTRGNQRGIEVDGQFVELRLEDNRWIVP